MYISILWKNISYFTKKGKAQQELPVGLKLCILDESYTFKDASYFLILRFSKYLANSLSSYIKTSLGLLPAAGPTTPMASN